MLSSGTQVNNCETNKIDETKLKQMRFTKRNKKEFTKQNEILPFTKQNFASFLFRETRKMSRNNFFVSICFVFQETKKGEIGNLMHN
jgi:hypothetical protein